MALQVSEPAFFPETKDLADQEYQHHIKQHSGDKSLVGQVIASVQPTADAEYILKRNRAEHDGTVQHEDHFV